MREEKQVLNINMESGNELVVRHGDAQSIFEYNGFSYDAYSTDSFVDLVKSKACKPNCVVAYNDAKMVAILDDKIVDRNQDRVTYAFIKSLQYKEWQEILESGGTFDQRSLIKFLQRREDGEIDDIEYFIGMLQNFRYVTNIQGDFSQADDQNYTFMIKVGEQEGSIKIPQVIYLNLEVFNESKFTQRIEIEVEVYKPKSEGEKPAIRFTCPKLQRYLKAAVDHEIEQLKASLDGYLIVTGRI